jgi:hypothetical protein
MPVTLRMETLTTGMKAKLDANYRTQNRTAINSSQHRSRCFLGDIVGKNRNTLIKRKR